jgi:hypothetical protein
VHRLPKHRLELAVDAHCHPRHRGHGSCHTTTTTTTTTTALNTDVVTVTSSGGGSSKNALV